MPLLQWTAGLTVFLSLMTTCDTLQCYKTDMSVDNCEPVDLWCIKFVNGSSITRGCANVYDYCTDDDPGCYPEREENGLTQKWCCCNNKDLCNSVSPPALLLSLCCVLSLFLIFT